MKKMTLKVVSVLLVCFTLIGISESTIVLAGFTHPEIGEFIVFLNENDKPFFTIYDFVQYKIMSPSSNYRGIDLTNNKKMPSFESSMDTFFDSIEGKSEEPIPVVFEYEGVLADYAYNLDSLSKEDKIDAIRLMAGFDGVKGFASLKKIPGLEDFDISYLEETYEDYTIDISGKSYPYRVLMFYIEEEDWQESYYERYAYIKDGRNWKLIQITKEYSSEYRQRNKYIHGLSGYIAADYDQIVHDALRGNTWFSSKEDVAGMENTVIGGDKIIIQKASIFRLHDELTYTYNKKQWLSSIEYRLQNNDAFYSAFISLYMRYYDPTDSSENRFSWSLPDTLIELYYEDNMPVIRLTPRFDQSNVTVG